MTHYTLHHNPQIPWHRERADCFMAGLQAIGHTCQTTTARHRITKGPVILFGTTCFRRIEQEKGDWLLVDRASYGDPDYVQLSWNGHGGRGDHKTLYDFGGDFESRWQRHADELGLMLHPWQENGSRVVLCGQESTFSPNWRRLEDWYDKMVPVCTHFRPHPAVGTNPTPLPIAQDFDDCRLAVVLNSSVAIHCMMNGIPVHVDDEGSLAHNVTFEGGNRLPFFEWLAWTQWSWDEITQGTPIAHLFDQSESIGVSSGEVA